MMARLSRVKEAGREFDLEFWAKVGSEGRLAAAWEMVCEVMAMRGGIGEPPRLDKTKARLIRVPYMVPGHQRARRNSPNSGTPTHRVATP